MGPDGVKGTKVRYEEQINEDANQWVDGAALERIKLIASRSKSGSFMGSEFSYEDLSSFSIDKFIFKGDAKVTTLHGKKVYKIERKPKSKYSGYTNQISFVDPKTFLILQVDYYDRKYELLKTAFFENYKKISGVWRVGKMRMINHQNDKKTVLIWKNERVKIGLKEKNFHKRVLKNNVL